MAEKKFKSSKSREDASNLNQEEQSDMQSRKLISSPIFPYTFPDDVDVVWNWNSPTSQPQYSKPKPVKVQQSPKILVKRHPSREQITTFNKLVEELKTLTNPIAEQELDKDYTDVFDDSLDEELLVISQKVEQSISQKHDHDKTVASCKQPTLSEVALGNDSFDCILATIKEEELSSKNGENSTKFEECVQEEPPLKCSAEEIEQKRLQALARREAKIMQNNIERNRQEALKRLALTRKRKILQ